MPATHLGLEPVLAKLNEQQPTLGTKKEEAREALTALKRWPWLSATALCEAKATAAQPGGAWERHTEFHEEHKDRQKGSGFDYEYFLVEHPLPPLEGQVFTPADGDNYSNATYQYAKSSQHKDFLMPLAIVYAASEQDVLAVINYAHSADIAVAVRSGGHHYIGASSTNGRNVLLDMSGAAFHSVDNSIGPAGETLVTVGPAVALAQLAQYNLDPTTNGLDPATGKEIEPGTATGTGQFFPHGQCSGVHFGGHCQTGGTGNVMAAFGLMCDRIQSIKIVLADQNIDESGGSVARTVDISRNTTDSYLADVFYSTIGASPGNFGVILSATVRATKDAELPNSRGMIMMYSYSKEKWKAVLEMHAKYLNAGGMPDELCFLSFVLPSSENDFANLHPVDLDTQQRFPDVYFGPSSGACRIFTPEQRKLLGWSHHYPVPMIVVTGLWANQKNPQQKYEESQLAQSFFKDIDVALGDGEGFTKDAMHFIKEHVASLFGMKLFHHTEGHLPMSQYMKCCMLLLVREYNMTYNQRFFIINKAEQGFSEYVAERTERGVNNSYSSKIKGITDGVEVLPFGPGYNNPPDDLTSISWRSAHGALCFANFYDHNAGAKKRATKHVDEIYQRFVGSDGLVVESDMRFIWAPYGSWNLDKNRVLYIDSEAKYQRVLATKKKADPYDVFTPNAFCVGASTSAKLLRNVSPAVAKQWELEGGEDVPRSPATAKEQAAAIARAQGDTDGSGR